MRIAILDDYQGVALEAADWSDIARQAQITAFREPLDQDMLVDQLAIFDVICVMRERTQFPGALLEKLPRLRLIASTGPRNAAIDTKAAAALGIEVSHTGYFSEPTVEHTWALILAATRHVVAEANAVRSGFWQTSVGGDLAGRTLGLLGLGNIGSRVAKVGQAFGMRTIAWSENLTAEGAASHGVERVAKEDLFAQADVLSIHLVLSARTRGLVDAKMLAHMQPSSWLVNTSRGPIVDDEALIAVLRGGGLAGAALDVFESEPLPQDHPYRMLPNVLATPHLGYVTRRLYETFYGDTVRNIGAWLARRATTGDDEAARSGGGR
jgi:phosphoglycerate dehydrogenase-like enzyme